MQLQENKSIFFDSTSHTYLCNGKMLMGLTGLMQKHSLGADYSGIPERVLAAAAEKGSQVHRLLQEYDEGNALLNEPLIEEYRNAIRDAGLTHIASEYLVSDNEVVATFIDKVYDTGIPGVVDLADVKTTLKVHKRALAWQLGANVVLFERQNPGIKVRNVFCIHIDKDTRKLRGLVPITPVSVEEVDALLLAEKEGRIYIDQHEEPSAELVLTDAELTAYVTQQAEIARLKEQIKGIEETLKGLDKRVLDYMLENDLVTIPGGGGEFRLKRAYERTTIDTERFRRMQPGLFEQYSKTSIVQASVSFKPNK